MASGDAEVDWVYNRLKEDGVFASLEWVSQCVEFIRSESGFSGDRLVLAVQEQWLSTDISTPEVMDYSLIPPHFSSIPKLTLDGKICLQVNYGYDIGNPAYGQLQKIYKLENENVRVSAEDNDSTQSGYQPSQGRFVASWEPKPSRMMSLNLTDGFQTFTAVEHKTNSSIPDDVVPGVKIELLGPLMCRRGKIFLTSNSLRFLGGEVEGMAERFETKNVLAQKIGRNMTEPAYKFLRSLVQPSAPPTTLGTTTAAHDRVASPPRPPLPAPPAPAPRNVNNADYDRNLLDSRDSAFRDREREGPFNHHVVQGTTQPHQPPSSYTHHAPLSSNDGDRFVDSMDFPDDDDDAFQDIDFELDEDMDAFEEIEMPEEEAVKVSVVSAEPFTYLSLVKEQVLRAPERSFSVTIKAVSSTLAGEMKVRKTETGFCWFLPIYLNDGSDFIRATWSPELLEKEVGSAADYVAIQRDNLDEKLRFKKNMKCLGIRLANLSALVRLRFPGGGVQPVVEETQEISGLHLAKLRRRKLA